MAAYSSTSRRPTEDERKRTEEPGKWHYELGHDIFNGLIVAFPILIIGVLIIEKFPALEWFLPWLVAGCFGLGTWTVIYFRRITADDRTSSPLDLVDVQEFHVVDVIEVEEFEDEGRHLFLKLHDGETLFLSGQYLYDDPDGMTYPSTRLERSVGRPTGILLDCRPIGEELRPDRILPHNLFDTLDQIPEDGEIVKIDLDQLKQ